MRRSFSFARLDIDHGEFQIRFADKGDSKLISDYFVKNRHHLKPWEPIREKSFYTEKGWEAKLIKLHELHLLELGFYCLIVCKRTGQMLGTISFSNLVRFPMHACSVGYSLDRDVQGRGVMRTALKLACQWMFETQNIHTINASYMPENKRSESVLMAAGFEPVGYAKQYLLINGKWEDHKLTSLINSQWKEDDE